MKSYCFSTEPSGLLILAALAPLALGGCGLSELRTPDRTQNGYVLVLPGIEGRSALNTSVAKGLADGGVPGAIEVYDWTLGGSVLTAVASLRAESHNRSEARKIARKILAYQDSHPGKPTHIVGHSGGGGVAVFALEALPPGRQVTSAILLGPALSPDYDLRGALRHTQQGIYNFYSPYDVGFLKVGTSVAGTIDGKHARAAGAVGFTMPWGMDQEDRQLYGSRLHQQPYNSKMADSGNIGTHVGWANRTFVAEWLAPLLNAQADVQTRFASDQNGG
jgi:pimeloyl-ACP methyl ester carboxylesterase